MRKKNAKRLVAAALAVVMAAGAMALPASAAADKAYTQELERILDEKTARQRTDLQRLMQKYPSSPEPYYWYGVSYQSDWETGTRPFNTASAQQAIQYLDQAIALGLQTEHPYQSKWESSEAGVFPMEDGVEQDYTAQAARRKADIYMWMQGQQEQAINAMGQYLDCWDRYTRIELKEADQQVPVDTQTYLSWGYTAEEAKEWAEQSRQWNIENDNEILNETIPELRAELNSIRQWYASGMPSSFTMGQNTRDGRNYGYLQVTGGKGDKTLTLNDIQTDGQTFKTKIALSQAIQSVQRTLNGITIFVPKGTQITVTGDGSIWDSLYDYDPGYWTADETPHILASPANEYNNGAVYVYVVGV